MSIRTNILARIYLAFGLILLFAGAVVVQLYRVQFVQGKKWRAMATTLTTRYQTVEAARGNIFSNDMSLLATSVPEYELHMDMLAPGIVDDKVFNEKVDSLALKLSQLYGDKSQRQYVRILRDARNDSSRYELIRRRVTFQELKQIRKFPIFNLGKYKGGLIVVEQNQRVFPFRTLAARTIGYKNDNVKNAVGLEGAYANYIEGESGKRLMQRMAGGAWMPVNNGDEEIEPKEGADIISTIDVNFQDVAQDALKKQLIKTQADHGCVVLMEVATGQIRAISNFTRTKDGDYKETYNYAISDAADPGSTFKLASYMTAFDQHKIDTNTLVNAENGTYNMYYKGKLLKTFKDAEAGNFVMTAKRAFEESSNVAIVKFISSHYGDNPRQFTDNLYALHLNERLVLQIPGEAKPVIKNPSNRSWSKLTLPEMAYGYEMHMTPLQMLTLYNGVANNGKMIAPIFVREIQRMGSTVEQFQARVINPQMCSEATLGKMKSMLEGVVQEGTGKTIIKNSLYSVAGKTGTAQIANGSSGYGVNKTYQASFCGYFPANHPKYSMIVVINHPTQGSYLAAYVAGPIFREIADRVYASDLEMNQAAPMHYAGNSNLPQIKKGNPRALKQVYNKLGVKPLYASNTPASGIDTSNGIAYEDVNYKSGVVPSVIGMGLSDALYILGNAGYKVAVRGSGTVTNQSVSGGSVISKGSKIIIELQ
ncbi:cell division protein FtsI (penicillin-binding protein 3) [Mucilaginibacter frigoritolerans]|jgi:cell division protein FtsI (penicillin-binding protein 3)|uniref:Cell division protein FtsI (Penicillin-binding protein 3) n=1 Tax=Mucilaginibacter frigoritolerans TaxID=652788 RepID=A0A562UEV5_9SPHI|nr:penicillin-binding protein [Mucilaginibacter frigoritolerans]TWJ04326.1 cell division protein FtsI (penicillin-binding protein 3) [Mucilaginibacter frigoritolerans]